MKKKITKTIIVKLNPTKKQTGILNDLMKKNEVILDYLQDKIDDYEKVKMDGIETAIPGKCSECGEEDYLDWEHQGKLICSKCLYKLHTGRSYYLRKELTPELKELVWMPNVDLYAEQIRRVYERHKEYLSSLSSFRKNPEGFNKKPKKPKNFNPNMMELGKTAYFAKKNGKRYMKMSLDGKDKDYVRVCENNERNNKYIDKFIEKYKPKDKFFETREEAEKFKEKLEKQKEERKLKGMIKILKMKSRDEKPYRVRRYPTKARCKLKKKNDNFYIHYPFSKEVEVPEPDETFDPVAVDLNLKDNIAVVSNTKNFIKSDIFEWLLHRDKIFKIFCEKGRYDKIKSNKLANKIDYESKKIARKIVEDAKKEKKPVIVLEKLDKIIERVTLRRKNGKSVKSKKAKKQNLKYNSWFFRKIFENIKYMANWEEIPVMKLEMAYSSQQCSKCGYIHKSNKGIYYKNKNGKERFNKSIFRCKRCGYELNSDLNATFNLRNRAKLKLRNPKKYKEFLKELREFNKKKDKKSLDVSSYFMFLES